ncbi:MAG: hypothetical protein ACI9QN_002185, partial [Arcticibacterium sp.]
EEAATIGLPKVLKRESMKERDLMKRLLVLQNSSIIMMLFCNSTL